MMEKNMQVVRSAEPMQTSMQAAFASWATIEHWLKKANELELPISINGLWGLDEVKKVVRDQQQVRDTVTAYVNKGMALKEDLPPEMRTGDKRDRIGFRWNPKYQGEPYRPSARVVAAQNKRAGKPTTTRASTPKSLPVNIRSDRAVLTESPKAVELMFQGMVLTVSRNPDNGNMRLVIDSIPD
jgi:hypothetical protein